jgi:hypothetical protein
MQVADDLIFEHGFEGRHGFLRMTASHTSLRGEYVAVDANEPERAPNCFVDSFAVDLGE